MQRKSPLKIGVMGYGWSPRTFHLPFIVPHTSDFQVVAFFQREGSRVFGQVGSNAEDDYPTARRYKDLESFLGDGEIELVVVTTTTSTHAEFAEKALSAGKHVLVEKPFTVTSAEAEHLIATAEKVHKVLAVFHNRRYDSDFLTLRKIISEGVLGDVAESDLHYELPYQLWVLGTGGPTEYVPGSGILNGLGTHIIDQALCLFGKPKTVTGFVRAVGNDFKSNTRMADNAYTIVLQYSGNQKDLFVTLKTSSVSLISPTQQLKYRVRGNKGSFVKYGGDPQAEQTLSGIDSMDSRYGYENPEFYGYLTTLEKVRDDQKQNGEFWEGRVKSERGNYHQIYQDVKKAIDGEILVPMNDPRAARDVIRIVELARQSQDEGKTLEF